MPPQLPNNQQQTPRHRVVAVMTRAQEDALHQLRRDGVSEGYALAVMQRISTLCLQTLRELDDLYREFEELLAADRSEAHQEWFETKAGGMLLTLEAFIAAVVTEASNKAKADYRDALLQPREVISVRPTPSRPGWQHVLQTTGTLLLWVAGMLSGLVLAWQTSGSSVVAGLGFLVAFVLWLMCGRRWWGLIFPLTGLGLEAWVLYWLFVVEGGY
jgi:hypothetical protein